MKTVTRALVTLSAIAAATLTTSVSDALEVWLRAGTFVTVMPDGQQVTMWGYATDPDKDFSTVEPNLVYQSPGPPVQVPAGDTTLTIHLFNGLGVPTSLMIPGQVTAMQPVFVDGGSVYQGSRPAGNYTARVRSLTAEAAIGSARDYSWANLKPGTYLYQSATHQAVQIQMGLFGAMTHDAAAGEAYPGATYQTEVVVVYSEIDPLLHAAVASGTYGVAPTSTIDYQPKYYLVNGAPYSNASADAATAPAGQTTLLRLLNAGLQTHVPMLQGLRMNLIAEDGNPYAYSRPQTSAILPAGKTLDALVQPAAAGRYALFDRRLFMHNAGISPGGLLQFLAVGN